MDRWIGLFVILQRSSKRLCGLFAFIILSVGVYVASCSTTRHQLEWSVYFFGLTVLSITETSTSVWIGSDDGLIVMNKKDGDTLVYTPGNSPLVSYSVSSLLTDDSGAVWMANGSQGLLRYWKNTWTAFSVDSGLPGSTVVQLQRSGTGFIAVTGSGIAFFDGARFTVTDPPMPGFYGAALTCATRDEDGDLWIGTWGGGLVQVSGSTWTKWTPSNSPIRTPFIFAVSPSPDGSVWIGEGGGLVHYKAGNWQQFNSLNSDLPQNDVTAVAVRKPDEIWLGMYEGGLAIFDSGGWTSFRPTNSDLPSDRVHCIFESTDGDLWIGTPLGLVRVRP